MKKPDEEVMRKNVVRDMLGFQMATPSSTPATRGTLPHGADGDHLLLSDVVMPLMKGPELATKLLAVSPSTKILLMSAYPMSEVAASGRAFLGKPFSVQALNDKVRQVLEHSSPFARPTRSS